MAREYTIVREIARDEIDQHAKRFIGITITEPKFKDQNGLSEWVCDIRVGVKEGWAVIKDCLIAQWAVGAITDVNIPVLAERSEGGRVTIIARSEIRLPDIVLDYYNYDELSFEFMRGIEDSGGGNYVDGFGYPVTYDEGTAPKYIQRSLRSSLIEWGGTDFVYGDTEFNEYTYEWETS